MNTTILEGYKSLPCGEKFIEWLTEKGILETFINAVEKRQNDEGRLADYYINRCKREGVPNLYIDKSLYFCRTIEGFDYWIDVNAKWDEYARANLKKKVYHFDVFSLLKRDLIFEAYSQKDAEEMLEKYIKDTVKDVIGKKFTYAAEQ